MRVLLDERISGGWNNDVDDDHDDDDDDEDTDDDDDDDDDNITTSVVGPRKTHQAKKLICVVFVPDCRIAIEDTYAKSLQKLYSRASKTGDTTVGFVPFGWGGGAGRIDKLRRSTRNPGHD